MRLAGKVALITGGASGMGQSEATIFAREGARVVVADLLEAEGRDVVASITKAGGQARYVKLDVTRMAVLIGPTVAPHSWVGARFLARTSCSSFSNRL